MGFPWGIAAVVGLGALAVASLSSPPVSTKKTGGGGGTPSPPPSDEFQVVHHTTLGKFKLSDFAKNDAVIVNLMTPKESFSALMVVATTGPSAFSATYVGPAPGIPAPSVSPVIGQKFTLVPDDVLQLTKAMIPIFPTDEDPIPKFGGPFGGGGAPTFGS